MTIHEADEGGDPSRSRAFQRGIACAMMVLGAGAVLLDWLLWSSVFPDAASWLHWAVPACGIAMVVAGERLYDRALRRLAPSATD